MRVLLLMLAFCAATLSAASQQSEIRVGQTLSYSGPLSIWGTIGRTQAAYFEKVNAEGGISGHRIRFISLDDGFSPPKTVEHTRRLVEQEDVHVLFQMMGSAPNAAIYKYANSRNVPHLFIASGAERFKDPQNAPWTIGWNPSYQTEGRIYARYLLRERPHGRIGILYQNDDLGRDYVKGFKEGLGARAREMIVSEVTFDVTDPTIDSQIVSLKATGADVFLDITPPKFTAQAIRKMYDIDWKPLHILNSIAASIPATFTPAGLERSAGIVSAHYLKDLGSADWNTDAGAREYLEFMHKYYPSGDPTDTLNVYGYTTAQALAQVLRQCGSDFTRDNIMKQATNLRALALPMLLPGITLSTSPTDYHPIERMQLQRFDGKRWVRFGELIDR